MLVSEKESLYNKRSMETKMALHFILLDPMPTLLTLLTYRKVPEQLLSRYVLTIVLD